MFGAIGNFAKGILDKVVPDRGKNNESQARTNEAEIAGAPASHLRLWRSFLGWVLALAFAWEVGMAQKDLKPVRSKEEAKSRGRKGGLASVAARREKKTLRQRLELLLNTKNGDMDTAEAVTIALIEKALAGDVRAYEVIRDTIGEKPTDKVDSHITGGLEIAWTK